MSLFSCSKEAQRFWATTFASVCKATAAGLAIGHYSDDEIDESSKRIYFRVDGRDEADGRGNLRGAILGIYILWMVLASTEVILGAFSMVTCCKMPKDNNEKNRARYMLLHLFSDAIAAVGLAFMTGSDEQMGIFFHAFVSGMTVCVLYATFTQLRYPQKSGDGRRSLAIVMYWVSLLLTFAAMITPYILYYFNVHYKDDNDNKSTSFALSLEYAAVSLVMSSLVVRFILMLVIEQREKNGYETEPSYAASSDEITRGVWAREVPHYLFALTVLFMLGFYATGVYDEDAPKYTLVSYYVENVTYIHRALNVGHYLILYPVCFYAFFLLVSLMFTSFVGAYQRAADMHRNRESMEFVMMSPVNGFCHVLLLMIVGAHDIHELVLAGTVIVLAELYWHHDTPNASKYSMFSFVIVFLGVVAVWGDIIAKLQYTELRKPAHHVVVYSAMIWYLTRFFYVVAKFKLHAVLGRSVPTKNAPHSILTSNMSQLGFVLTAIGGCFANTLHTEAQIGQFIL